MLRRRRTTATVDEGALVALGATDTAGNVTITGLPHDLSNFNGGSYTATTGSWSGTAPQFDALTFTAGEAGTFTLAIAATTAGAPHHRELALTVQPAAASARRRHHGNRHGRRARHPRRLRHGGLR